MTLGLRGRLFAASIAAIALALVAADLYLVRALERQWTERVRDDLFVRLELATLHARDERPVAAGWDDFADRLGTAASARITVIGADGRVLGDSDVAAAALGAVENHGSRPEVRLARDAGRGWDTRRSATVGRTMMYAAVPLAAGTRSGAIVRAAIPLTDVEAASSRLRTSLAVASLLALLVAAAFSGFAANWAAARVRDVAQAARRIAAGELALRVRPSGGGEVRELSEALETLASGLADSLRSLTSERDLLGGVLDAMREGVLVLDPDGRVRRGNAAARALLGAGDEITGRTLLELARIPALHEICADARSRGDSIDGEVEFASLPPRTLGIHAAPLAAESGALLVVLVDLTDLRRLETVRREFVANASHELKTPVAAIASAAETLQGGAADDRAASAKFVEIVARNADRLRRLVDDLLDLSRIESRSLALAIEPLPASEVLEHVAGLHRSAAEARRTRLVVEADPGATFVLGDRRALEQVLTNLVDNAIKYSPEGSVVRLRVGLRATGVELSVSDDGPGMEARHLPRLFERFYRVDPGRSRELGGTGLGLAIVKHLAEAMDGSVSVASEVGRGTRFTVRLPAVGRPVG